MPSHFRKGHSLAPGTFHLKKIAIEVTTLGPSLYMQILDILQRGGHYKGRNSRSRLSSATKKCFLQPCYCVILLWVVLLVRLRILHEIRDSSCYFKLFYASYLWPQSGGSLEPIVPGQTTVSNIIYRSCHITLSKFKSHFSPSDSESRISYISSWSNSKALRGQILPMKKVAPVCLSAYTT
jgi:hypothetical protein